MTRSGAAILAALLALSAFAVDITLSALPATAAALGADPTRSGLIVTAYLAGFAPGQLLWGLLADRIGRRPAVLGGLIAFIIATSACALASDFGTLLAARAAQGLMGGVGPVLARVIVRDVASGAEAARLFAGLTVALAATPLLAPLVGAALLGAAGWRSLFWTTVLYAAALTSLVATRLHETRPADAHASGPPLWRRTLWLFRQRDYVLGVALVSTSFGGYPTILALYPAIAILDHGVSEGSFALLFAAAAAFYVLGAVLSRLLVRRAGARALMASAVACSLAGALLVAAAAAGAGLLPLAAGACACLLGVGQMMPLATAHALRPAGEAAGWAVALLGLAQTAAAALLSYVAGIVGRPAMNLAAVLLACALASGLLLARLGRSATAPQPGAA